MSSLTADELVALARETGSARGPGVVAGVRLPDGRTLHAREMDDETRASAQALIDTLSNGHPSHPDSGQGEKKKPEAGGQI